MQAREVAGVDRLVLDAAWTGRSATVAAQNLRATGPVFRAVSDAADTAAFTLREAAQVLRRGQQRAWELRCEAQGTTDDEALRWMRDRLRYLVNDVEWHQVAARGRLDLVMASPWAPVLHRAQGPIQGGELAVALLTSHAESLLRWLGDQSHDVQRQQWDALTASQRDALIEQFPQLVLTLRGLSDDVVQRALASFKTQQPDDISVASQTDVVEAKATIAWFRIKGLAAASMTESLDGEVLVTLVGGAAIGVARSRGQNGNKGEASLTAGPEDRRVYRFDDRKSAEAFMHTLEKAASDPRRLSSLALDPKPKGGTLVDHVIGVTSLAELSGSIRWLGGAHMSLSTTNELSLVTKSTTQTASFDIGASVRLAPTFGATLTGSVDGTATVTQTTSRLGEVTRSLRLQLSAEGAGGFGKGLAKQIGIPTDGVQYSVDSFHTRGVALDITMEADLDNPQVAAIGKSLAMGKMSPVDAAVALGKVTTVVATVSTTSTHESSIDLEVVEASATQHGSTASAMFVKPAGSNEFTALCAANDRPMQLCNSGA